MKVYIIRYETSMVESAFTSVEKAVEYIISQEPEEDWHNFNKPEWAGLSFDKIVEHFKNNKDSYATIEELDVDPSNFNNVDLMDI